MPKTIPNKANAPAVTVKSQEGRMNRRLKMLSDMYLKNHPGKSTRWVYSPEHKPDLSNVVSRQADGYALVYNKDLGKEFLDSLPGLKPEDAVRIGDVVLMSIAAEAQKAFQRELDERAKGELERVEKEFHQNISDMEVPGGKMREEYRARPRGRSVIEEVEREVSVDPTLRDDEPTE